LSFRGRKKDANAKGCLPRPEGRKGKLRKEKRYASRTVLVKKKLGLRLLWERGGGWSQKKSLFARPFCRKRHFPVGRVEATKKDTPAGKNQV